MSRTDSRSLVNPLDDVPSLGVAQAATSVSHHLAEGVVWDRIRRTLLWVDIPVGAVHVGRLRGDGSIVSERRIDVPGDAAAVAPSASGELLIAGTHRLHYVATDGIVRAGRRLIEGDARRFNDGKPDPAGRFVVGTKGPGPESLFMVDGDETIAVIDDDLTLSNGLAWTGDGLRLYSVDTLSRRIFVRDYDPGSGTTGRRNVFVTFTHGHPDGMTIDAEDHLWVAVWGEGCVVRIDPDGAIVARVDVPAPHTSCPVFAGPDLDTLVITTAREDLSPEQLAAHPLSGRLFTIKPGARGIAPNLWSGRVESATARGNP